MRSQLETGVFDIETLAECTTSEFDAIVNELNEDELDELLEIIGTDLGMPAPNERPAPRDPPQADVGWPENVGMHDQVAAAMLDFLTNEWEEKPREEVTPEEAAVRDREVDVLIELGKSVPPGRSVSVLVEFQDGHVLATMLNDERGPAMTILHYGLDDPNRLGDPQEAGCMFLAPPEHLVS